MKTATRLLVWGSLLAAGCSGDAGENNSGAAGMPSSGDPTVPVLDASGNPVLDASGNPITMPAPTTDVSGQPVANPSVPTPTANPTTTPTSEGTSPIEEPLPPDTGSCVLGVPVTSQIPRLTNLQYDTVIADVLGVTAPSGSWSATFEPDSRGELSNTQWAQYRSKAGEIATAVMGTSLGTELTTAAADPVALETSIRNIGRRMFRRPLSDDEVSSFMSLMDVTPAGTPAEIAEAVLYTLLISPSFLMRTELDAPEEAVPGTEATAAPQLAFKLSNHEVASRLSFLIWNSVPDATLDAAADAGELQTKEQIQAQAARMVGPEFQDKVTPVIIAAHRFYANIDANSSLSRWGKTTHDATRFPEYTEAQNAPLLAEMDSFFAEVGFTGQFQDLFLSTVAYVNQDTAPLYGVTGDFGPELQRVELTGTERPGFLTRGAFLSAFAHERDTSPILRGAYIIGLMGGELGIPNPEFALMPIPPGEYENNREAVTALTAGAECVTCHHTIINPPGFVLESFSAVGSIQTTDPEYGGPITTAVDSVAFPGGAKPVANALELMTEIAAGSVAKQIYARKWVAYATGRDSNDFDECTAATIAGKMSAGSYTLSSVLADLTQAESFRYRVAAQ